MEPCDWLTWANGALWLATVRDGMTGCGCKLLTLRAEVRVKLLAISLEESGMLLVDSRSTGLNTVLWLVNSSRTIINTVFRLVDNDSRSKGLNTVFWLVNTSRARINTVFRLVDYARSDSISKGQNRASWKADSTSRRFWWVETESPHNSKCSHNVLSSHGSENSTFSFLISQSCLPMYPTCQTTWTGNIHRYNSPIKPCSVGCIFLVFT